jgi:hypothetical protein
MLDPSDPLDRFDHYDSSYDHYDQSRDFAGVGP